MEETPAANIFIDSSKYIDDDTICRNLDSDMALRIGDRAEWGTIQSSHLEKEAVVIGVNRHYLVEKAGELAEKIRKVLPSVSEEAGKETGNSAFISTLTGQIRRHLKRAPS